MIYITGSFFFLFHSCTTFSHLCLEFWLIFYQYVSFLEDIFGSDIIYIVARWGTMTARIHTKIYPRSSYFSTGSHAGFVTVP